MKTQTKAVAQRRAQLSVGSIVGAGALVLATARAMRGRCRTDGVGVGLSA